MVNNRFVAGLAGIVLTIAGCTAPQKPTIVQESYIAQPKTSEDLTERLRKIRKSAEEEIQRKIDKHWESHKRNKLYTPSDSKDENGEHAVDFEGISPILLEGLTGVRVIPKSDWQGLPVRGMTHAEDNTICITQGYRKETLYHELFHNFHNQTEKKNQGFMQKWKAIKPVPYKDIMEFKHDTYEGSLTLDAYWKDWPEGTQGPKEGPRYGILEPYGGKDEHEDIALYGNALAYIQTPDEIINDLRKTAKKFLNGLTSLETTEKEIMSLLEIALRLEPLYFCDPKEPAYKQKLDLLNDYGAFTPEQYKTLSKNMGKLHKYWTDEKLIETVIRETIDEAVYD